MADMWVWNRAHDDMFSKSSALPRHSFEEQPARREERKRDSNVSVVEAAGGRLAEFSANDPRRLANLFSRGLEIHADGASSDTNCCGRKEREQEVPWHAAPVM